MKEVITAIRDARSKAQLKPKDSIQLHILTENEEAYRPIVHIMGKQVNAGSVSFTKTNVPGTITVVVQKDKFFLEADAALDKGSQREQLEKDLEYLKGFLISVDRKLGNAKFVNNAKPEVVEMERKKKADAEARIRVIEESLALL